ncbi:MAG: aldolase [Betaproteobacteria bacterium]
MLGATSSNLTADPQHLVQAKQTYYATSNAAAERSFPLTQWTLPQKLAIACRALAMAGHNAGFGLASQVSARAVSESLWTQQYGLALEEATASNQIEADFDLKPLRGERMVNPANRFHAWIYRRRGDVAAIVHTHPPYTCALSMLGVPLHVAHMDTTPLYGRVAHLEVWPGVPFGDEEGRLISERLGSDKAILLAHHGLITVGGSVEEACVLAMVFEHAARLQLLAAGAAAPLQPLEPALGDDARRFAEQPIYAPAHFAYYARRVLAVQPEALA